MDCMKRAWIRNPDIPAGQPAPGHISCPCGHAPESDFSPENGNVTCACGVVYTWDGWIVNGGADRNLKANGGQSSSSPGRSRLD